MNSSLLLSSLFLGLWIVTVVGYPIYAMGVYGSRLAFAPGPPHIPPLVWLLAWLLAVLAYPVVVVLRYQGRPKLADVIGIALVAPAFSRLVWLIVATFRRRR